MWIYSFKGTLIMKLVTIIILNWNGWKDTIECLESVYQNNYPNFNVIVIDNGSNDDSVKQIKKYCEGRIKTESSYFTFDSNNKPIKYLEIRQKQEKTKIMKHSNNELILIKNTENRGFAEGNNIGVNYALNHINSEYIMLLNNDTIVEKNFLTELVNVLNKHDDAGSVQSLLLKPNKLNVDSSGQKMLCWGAKEITEPITSPFNQTIEIFGACAASALYRKDLIKKIGLFEDDFFVLLEDVDLSWKIKLLGFKSYLAGNSVVYHKRGISKTNSLNYILKTAIHKKNPQKLMKWYHESKNWFIIFIRYYPLRMLFISLIKCPKKVFLSFLLLFYSSVRTGNTYKVLILFSKNYKIRNKNKKNELLVNIQNNWIKCGY
jgi:GT2 family glycosyltransferase